MLHIFGIYLKPTQKVYIGLTTIFGIGLNLSKQICYKAGITKECKISDLKELNVIKLSKVLSTEYLIETDLKKEIRYNIKRFIDIKSYKGFRFINKLPVRGQRTKTNRATQKMLASRFTLKQIK